MNQFKYTFVLFVAVIFCGNSIAQQSLTLYNLQATPQAMQINPSAQPNCKLYLGGLLPLITPGSPSLYFNKSTNGPTITDLVRKDGSGVDIDFENAIKRSSKNNYFSLATQIDWLDFGFKVKSNFFTVSVIEKVYGRFRYPQDFLTFVFEGNGKNENLGKPLNFNFGLDASHYREYGIGYNREVKADKLWIGGKLKYLYGMENINTVKSDMMLTTGDTIYELTAQSDVLINTAGLDSSSFSDMSPMSYAFGRKNSGFGIDLGATYKINNKISVSGSVIDLGYIKWKDQVNNYTLNGSYSYSGIDIKKVFTDSTSFDEALTNSADSVLGTFTATTSKNSYKTWLPAQTYLSGYYHINNKNKAGAMLYTQFYDKKPHAGFSLSYTTQVGRWLNATANYSFLNRSWKNIGAGLALNLGPFQAYIASDNILGFMIFQKFGASDSTGKYTGVPYPGSARNINLRVGFNWTFGRKPSDKDKDGIADKKDECPDIAGLAEFKGCPDKDGDKIQDKDDVCPEIAGKPEFKGCPDTDNDGIVDSDDACATEAGPKETKGCPDKDGDGIRDTEDECMDVFGLATLKGCPDKDSDGITDSKDECPDVAGTEAGNGCPDTDGDGIFDNKDLCPAEAGPKENNGCPWKDSDGDGVLDKDDECPETKGIVALKGCPDNDKDGDGLLDKDDACPLSAGPASNKGCPELKKEEQEAINAAFENLEFEVGKDIILASSFEELDQLASVLIKRPKSILTIEGHTDNVGDPKKNLALSQKRAEAVLKYLISKGVDGTHMTAKGFGSKKPIASNKTEEGRKHNRRVEMKLGFK